jgi:hypothetical protein
VKKAVYWPWYPAFRMRVILRWRLRVSLYGLGLQN